MDVNSRQFSQIISEFNMIQSVETPKHALGGLLDVVIATRDFLPLEVKVIDMGLSDHSLVCWKLSFFRPPPTYETIYCRNWKNL